MTPKGRFDEFATHVRNVKALAHAQGRELDVYAVGVITCRTTRRDAEAYYRHCVIDNADGTAMDHIMAMRGVTPDKYPDDFDERRAHQANGMGGVPIVGDPDDVTGELARLSAAGARGIAVAFVNHFRDIFPAACCALIMGHEQLYPQKPQCHGVAVSPRVSGEVPSCGY
jgi:alkanesulfonate monooxygenase SsuD/methylene tetrahydromethanopterin reductase-like flavin-dependent oxidoreductase (luciferase family)